MTITDWREFRDTLVISPGFDPVPLPTNADLDAFEHTHGFRLPKSYRDFAVVFGPGEFGYGLIIATPSHQGKLSHLDLATSHLGWRPRQDELPRFPIADRARAERAIHFGMIRGRDWLCWDRENVQNPAESEYNIYCRIDYSFELIATSFRQLIEEVCGRMFAPDPNWDEDDLGPQREFRCATRVFDH